MKIELLTIEQLSDLSQSGQSEILQQELVYSNDYLAKYANHNDYPDLYRIICDYIELVEDYYLIT